MSEQREHRCVGFFRCWRCGKTLQRKGITPMTPDKKEERAEYHPEWKPDCGGKWDYDCDLVSLSCRYYPAGGGFFVLDTNRNTFEGNEARPEIRPFAIAAICIGDLVNGPYEDLAKAEFEGDTETEVKAQVEAWAKEMIARVESVIRKEFASDPR